MEHHLCYFRCQPGDLRSQQGDSWKLTTCGEVAGMRSLSTLAHALALSADLFHFLFPFRCRWFQRAFLHSPKDLVVQDRKASSGLFQRSYRRVWPSHLHLFPFVLSDHKSLQARFCHRGGVSMVWGDRWGHRKSKLKPLRPMHADVW